MKSQSKCMIISVILSLLLSACGTAPAPDGDFTLTDDDTYAYYAGYQFSGKDPWGGTITVTIRNIFDGNLEWTLVDSFKNATFYFSQKESVLQNGMTEFDIQGTDVESKDISFAFQGRLELKDEIITITFQSASASDPSSDFEINHSDDDLSQPIILDRAEGPYAIYYVQEGDSLHSIAKKFGMSTKDLAILNQIIIVETAKAHGLEFDDAAEYAQYLFVGEELLVPIKSR